MSSLQLLESRTQSTIDAQLSELDAALEQSFREAENPSNAPADAVFRSRYRPQTFASVEELVARDIAAYTRRRTQPQNR